MRPPPDSSPSAAPLVVEVARARSEDGPGLRSVVFFKGCPMRCSFCQNPEAQEVGPELAFWGDRCREFGACEAACEHGAIDLLRPERIDRERCIRCDACAQACPSGALRRIGRAMEPEALAELLLRDRHFYAASGGGVTLSGGEPTMFPRYVEALLRILHAEGVHVTLETGGHFEPYEEIQRRVLPYVDLLYFSLKLADPELHRRHTGHSNALILRNLARLLDEPDLEVEVRVPLVPGITDTADNLRGLAEILRRVGARSVQLLPYNPLGRSMATALGRPAPQVPGSFMSPAQIESAQRELLDALRLDG